MQSFMKSIDLNCDLGESFGAWEMGNDTEIMPLVSSVNIATGWHAGDPLIMAKTVQNAGKLNLGIGAHPGFPDLMGFGRRHMNVSPEETKAYVLYQVGALNAFVKAEGLRLQHVKPHGAKDLKLAVAIAEAVSLIDSNLVLMGLANSQMAVAAEQVGIPFASEVFADRRYQTDGSLVPRGQNGAVIETDEEALQQVLQMVCEGQVTTLTGECITLKADSVCVHGDNPHAIEFVQRIRMALTEKNIAIKPWDGLFGQVKIHG
jgi:UPF0271 protein